jgi:hypothetical protein
VHPTNRNVEQIRARSDKKKEAKAFAAFREYSKTKRIATERSLRKRNQQSPERIATNNRTNHFFTPKEIQNSTRSS